MKVLFVMDAGVAEYRSFLFEGLKEEKEISDLLVIHNGRIYNGKGNYNSVKLKFIGNDKIGFYVGLWKYIKDYDVIVSSYNLRNLSCWIPSFFKKKWIFWGKGLGEDEGVIVKLIRKITANNVSRLLVYNKFKKDELVSKLGIPESKVIAYNNTIRISNPGIDINVEKKYFLYFGRIQERKGLLQIIEEYNKYLKSTLGGNVLKLRFVGNGEFKTKLESEVDRLKLNEFVEFYPGVYDDSDIKQHFLGAKAYISPYNVGLAVVNSFAYGVPVITCVKPQIGPEFHYLTKDNSFIIQNVSYLNSVLKQVEKIDSIDYSRNILEYYKVNIGSDFMYSHFYRTILEVGRNG